jgi:hypothetical protein
MKADSNSFTHEEISRKAYALWEQRGRPDGFADGIWLDAESQLRAEARDAIPRQAVGPDESRRSSKSEGGPSIPHKAIAPTEIDHRSIVTEVQKHDARTPQVPHHTGPKPKPAETGKPVWSKAHGA